MDRSKLLEEERIDKLLIKFSVPAIVGMLVNALYNIVDRIFIGKGVGRLGIAGITIGAPISIIIMAFGMLIGIGANALISIRLGQKKRKRCRIDIGKCNNTSYLYIYNNQYCRTYILRTNFKSFWCK